MQQAKAAAQQETEEIQNVLRRRTISLRGRLLPAASSDSPKQKKGRRSSVDEGSPDWPAAEDVANALPVLTNDADNRLCELVGEIRELEIVVPHHLPETLNSRPLEEDFNAQQKQQPYEICKIHLPNAAELPAFPKVLRDHLVNAALATLRLHFYPCVLLRQRIITRTRAMLQRQPLAAQVPPDLLDGIPLFRGWPAEALKLVLSSLKYSLYEQREVIVHEKEPSTVMYFLTAGSVKTISRVKGKLKLDKRLSGANVAHSTILVAPCTFGSQNLLTNELWSHAVRSNAKCDVYTLSRQDFNAAMALVPLETTTETIRTAFERRNELMPSNFPLDVDAIRKHNIFSRVSVEFAKDLIDRLEANAVPESFVLTREGEVSAAMYFVRRGTVKVYRKVDGAESNATVITGPTVIGDTALVYNSANSMSCKTVTDCDVYSLSRHNFDMLCRQYTSDVDAMLDAARDQRNAELKSNYLKFRRVLTDMPILNSLVQPYHLRDFLALVQPKSYRPMSCICSTSDFCDRVIVLTKGKITLGRHDGVSGTANGQQHTMQRWESIGWTCCVPHRWAQPEMTMSSTVEVLEIPFLDLMMFLHERRLLDQVTHATKMIMFPRAFPSAETDALRAKIGPHFVMYPTSRSFAVNLNEMGFCTVHMSEIKRLEQAERERAAHEVSTGAPQYKKLSQGVWIPTSRRIRGFTTSKN